MSGRDYIGTALLGTISAMDAYGSLDKLLTVSQTKKAIIEKYLDNAPQVTDAVYTAAIQRADEMTNGDLITGLIYAAIAGFFAATTLYIMPSQKKE